MDEFNSFIIEKFELLAEFIGIILGDGHLHKKGEKSYDGNLLSISLNRVDEPELVGLTPGGKLKTFLFDFSMRQKGRLSYLKSMPDFFASLMASHLLCSIPKIGPSSY